MHIHNSKYAFELKSNIAFRHVYNLIDSIAENIKPIKPDFNYYEYLDDIVTNVDFKLIEKTNNKDDIEEYYSFLYSTLVNMVFPKIEAIFINYNKTIAAQHYYVNIKIREDVLAKLNELKAKSSNVEKPIKTLAKYQLEFIEEIQKRKKLRHTECFLLDHYYSIVLHFIFIDRYKQLIEALNSMISVKENNQAKEPLLNAFFSSHSSLLMYKKHFIHQYKAKNVDYFTAIEPKETEHKIIAFEFEKEIRHQSIQLESERKLKSYLGQIQTKLNLVYEYVEHEHKTKDFSVATDYDNSIPGIQNLIRSIAKQRGFPIPGDIIIDEDQAKKTSPIRYKVSNGRKESLADVCNTLKTSGLIDDINSQKFKSIILNSTNNSYINWIGSLTSLHYFIKEFGDISENKKLRWEAAIQVFTRNGDKLDKKILQNTNKGVSKKDKAIIDKAIRQIAINS